jgi:hypothetical protein
VGLANYLSRHWSDYSWWPLWHCGMPYTDTYVPLLHLLVAATATLSKIGAAHAYHAVTGLFYVLGPITLYLMAVRLGAGRGSAFVGALFYSLFSPCTLMMPDIAKDLGGFWGCRRLQVLVVYGEGPHVSDMTLLPLGILALQSALQSRTRRALAWAALTFAAVFSMNVPGSMAAGVAVFCWLCVQPAGERRAAWILAAVSAAFGYAIACYGIPPSSLRTVVGNVGAMHAGFSAGLRAAGPLLLAASLACAAAIGWWLSRTRVALFLRFAMLNFLLLALLVLTARPERFELLPQAGRLHLEMEMGACLILGSLAWFLYSLIPGWVRPIAIVLCLAPFGLQLEHYRARARMELEPVDLAKRSEYTSARWADAHLPGQRIYVAGSTSFWWNAFTDDPQLVGCCAQNQSVPILKDVPYLVDLPGSASDTARITPYLQALGVQALVANGPGSTDEYKDVHSPQRFDALLPVLHREMGDTIYAIPQRTTSLAHAIGSAEAVPVPVPADKPLSSDDILRYAAVLQDPARPIADFSWMRGGTARIAATLTPADLISVQVAWFRGWKAYVAGHSIPVTRDGLGFLLLHPACTGPCEIMLRWTGRPDLIPSAAISVAAAGLFGFLAFGRRTSLPKKWIA